MNNQETHLRKKYLQLVQNFRYLLAKNTEDTDKLNNKYLPKFRKNRFWIKFHITNIILPIFLGALLSGVAINTGIDKKYTLYPLYAGIGIAIFIVYKLIRQLQLKKKLKNDYNGELANIQSQFLQPGERNLKQAAYLVVDLMIEEEIGNQVYEIKMKSSPKVFDQFYAKLRTKYATILKERSLKYSKSKTLTFNDIISYYDFWYDHRHSKSRSGEERLKANIARVRQ